MDNQKKYIIYWVALGLLLLQACGGSQSDKKKEAQKEPTRKEIVAPAFNADKAYEYLEKQVAFGPRVPNTPAHDSTKNYIINTLEQMEASVKTQVFEAKTYDNETWNLTNIIASIAPDKKKRILLAAHWDSRKIADKDTERTNEPIDGANDGASGVAVAMEIIRTIQQASNKPNVGIDVIFFDGEDNGEPNGRRVQTPDPDGSWWCLGSQYWSKNKHTAGYSAYYGILFDMVGAQDASFHMEGFSMEFAPSIVNKVWNAAERIGYGLYFVPNEVAPITDDHYYVNKYAKIPMIDIIAYDPLSDQFFPDYHHTHDDNMDIISKETLKAVGQTVLQVIYEE